MRERPILFSGPMVRAILEGRKTVTRRVLGLKGRFNIFAPGEWTDDYVMDPGNAGWRADYLPCAAGDRLWVRETWARAWELDDAGEPATAEQTYYRADGEPFSSWDNGDGTFRDGIPWKPSIFMPRRFSRITLEVTGVEVERLQQIDEAEALAEGIIRADDGTPPVYWTERARDPKGAFSETAVGAFRYLWDSINGEREGASWKANPWVAAISFRRFEA